MKHTNGPWEIKILPQDRYLSDIHIVKKGTDSVVAYVDRVFNHRKAFENAALIAAAPTMLKALELASKVMRSVKYQIDLTKDVELIDAAIKKAKGGE